MAFRLALLAAVPTLAMIGTSACAGPITVIDGDTVERDGMRWRLSGLDAPEIHGAKCASERHLGIAAAARLVMLLSDRGGRIIDIRDRNGAQKRDKYGRHVGTLVIGWPSTGEDEWSAIAIRENLAVPWAGKGKRHNWCE